MKICHYEQDCCSFCLCNCMAHDGKFMGSNFGPEKRVSRDIIIC